MKGFAISHVAEVGVIEVKELTGAKAEARQAAVVFSVKKPEDLAKLCYLGQSFSRVALLLKQAEIARQLPDTKKLVEGVDVKQFFKKGTTFKVECVREGEHDFNSADIAEAFGEAIVQKLGRAKVDLEQPGIIFLVYIHGKDLYFGLDYAGFDLSKREYRIYTSPHSLKGTTAYSLLRISGYKKGQVLLDPFCSTGEIVIEAAIWQSGHSVNFYSKDKLAFNKFMKFDFEKVDKKADSQKKLEIFAYDAQQRLMKHAQKNAKIAGINKAITISRVDVEWLDIKFKKEQADLIVTALPAWSRLVNIHELEKQYNEFFYQAEYILKKQGTITCICNKPELATKYAEKHGFKLMKTSSLMQGQMEMVVLAFKKG